VELTIDQALQQGVAAHKEGKLQDAERLYRAILQARPNHPDANHNLGVLAVAVGKPIEAIPLFKKALEANPKIEQFWLSYIDALIKVERFDDAKQVFTDAEQSGVSVEKLKILNQRLNSNVSKNTSETANGLMLSEKRKARNESSGAAPSQEQVNSLKGHYQAGRFNDAEALATSMTQEFPKYQFGWKVLGAVFKQTGRLNESLSAMQKSVELSPRDAEAHNNLGVTLLELGRLGEAEASQRQAIALNPDYVEAYSNLGATLQELDKLDEAEASYRRAIALEPDYVEAHYNLGVTLKELGRLDEAEASYRQAIALKPDHAVGHNNLGVTLQELGRLDEAEANFRRAIALKPDYVEAYRNLTNTKEFSSKDVNFLQMQALYYDPAISEDARCHIAFALAKAYEDLESFAEAFQFYAEGNAIRKKQLGYDKEQDKNFFELLKASCTRIAAYPYQPEIAATEPAPIFIVGMLRSGTTLVEQIISSHHLVTGAGELPFAGQFGGALAVGQTPVVKEALQAFRERYLSTLRHRSEGKAIVTDKMPQNFRWLGVIAAAFPEAKIIHVQRDSAAVCWANYTQYFVRNSLGYCYSLDDILHYHGLYVDLMKFWHQALPGRIYDLDYEVLTEHQEQETRKLIDHLGLSWDDGCLSPQDNTRRVTTASSAQVRKKVYKGSSERWKRYQPYLNGALDHLSAGKK
jgi:tetratricopeptide (TPR) repeat protein